MLPAGTLTVVATSGPDVPARATPETSPSPVAAARRGREETVETDGALHVVLPGWLSRIAGGDVGDRTFRELPFPSPAPASGASAWTDRTGGV